MSETEKRTNVLKGALLGGFSLACGRRRASWSRLDLCSRTFDLLSMVHEAVSESKI